MTDNIEGPEPRAVPALSLSGAAKTFGPVVAVADGTIEILAGEIQRSSVRTAPASPRS